MEGRGGGGVQNGRGGGKLSFEIVLTQELEVLAILSDNRFRKSMEDVY